MPRQRSIKFQLWLNADEEKLLKEKAKKAGLSCSEFLRFTLYCYKLKEQPTEEIKEFNKQLIGIANNVNQIAKHANTYYSVPVNDFANMKSTLYEFINKFEKKFY